MATRLIELSKTVSVITLAEIEGRGIRTTAQIDFHPLVFKYALLNPVAWPARRGGRSR